MNFVKLTRIYRPVNGHTGEKMENIETQIWIDVFQIYMVEITVKGYVRITLKPIKPGSIAEVVDISLESIPVLEEALKKHNLSW